MERCLTLANALLGHSTRTTFAVRHCPDALEEKIRAQGHSVERLRKGSNDQSLTGYLRWLGVSSSRDAAETLEVARSVEADLVVVDHYALGLEWEASLATVGAAIMAIDDLADRVHHADLLLDQNLGRCAEHYSKLVPSDCEVLTGPEFGLLRPEFAAERSAALARRKDPGRHLLISLGGVDKDDFSGRVLRELAELGWHSLEQLTVVMGSSAPHRDAVCRLLEDCPIPHRVEVDSDQMAALFRDADLAVGGAGSTSWERCALGLPSLLVVQSENQTVIADSLEKAGAAISSGTNPKAEDLARLLALLDRPSDYRRLSNNASVLCDGRGTGRVAAAVNRMKHAVDLLKPLTETDLQILLEWRNHDDVRRHMYSSRPIAFADHCRWFENLKRDPLRQAFIYECEGKPSGFVQFERDDAGTVAEWGFHAAPGSPKGTGRRLGTLALDYLFGVIGCDAVRGAVILSNYASLSFHRVFGFEPDGQPVEIRKGDYSGDVQYLRLTRDRWFECRKV